MKLVLLKENVMIPNSPSFKKGQEVRINDTLADLLISRGHAKLVKKENARKETKELKKEHEKEEKDKLKK
jgi:hypothetical protein